VKLGMLKEAVADAEVCIRLDPGLHKGYGRKGSALLAMKMYNEAVATYKKALKLAPAEEYLKMGLEAAKFAKRENNTARRAVQRAQIVHQSSQSNQYKASKAPTGSAFVQETRRRLKLEMAALQAQLDLLNELEELSDNDKLEMLFGLIDDNNDGTVDSAELATAMRKGNTSLGLADAIERAIQTVAVFDTNGDTKLDFKEFTTCIEATKEELGMTLGEFVEFMALPLTSADGPSTKANDKEVVPSEAEITKQVKDQEEYIAVLSDPRLKELFNLFDKDGTHELSFMEVAVGLYRLTHNMEESTRTTMGLLFMIDKDDKRKLDYAQFGRLVMAVVAASTSSFEDVVNDLVFALTTDDTIPEADLQSLYIADSMYAGAVEMTHKTEKVHRITDPVSYSRIQKLFDLWDVDNTNHISRGALSKGLQHYHEAAHDGGNAAEEAATLLELDQEGDVQLDRLDFARALVKFAEVLEKDLNEVYVPDMQASVFDPVVPHPRYRPCYTASIS
jgi:Ca2+-binding EF-hand superfamily protein